MFVCVFHGELYIVTALSIVYVGLCNLNCTSKNVWIEKLKIIHDTKSSKAPLQPVYNIDKWTCHDVRKRDSEMYKQSGIINNIYLNILTQS